MLTLRDLRYLIELVDSDLSYDVVDRQRQSARERAQWAYVRTVKRKLCKMKEVRLVAKATKKSAAKGKVTKKK